MRPYLEATDSSAFLSPRPLLFCAVPFTKFGLSGAILEGVKAMGYVEPTPIQLRAIPLILAGQDVIGSAQTGTGKTAAFALPILSRLGSRSTGTRVLVLEPTRELAAQVETAIRDFARFTDLRVAVVYGGVGYGRQIEALRGGVDVIVATPGRLLDHLRQGACKLDQVKFLVLDEADRMLDMGFLPDVRRIVEKCPRERHTSLFSATIPPEIESLIRWAMLHPQTVEIGARRTPAETVKHVIYPVAQDQKADLLQELLERVNYDSVIVFCRTKNRADRLGKLLRRSNHAVTILHSNRTQREREQALRANVSHVINFDVPQHPEDYVHRIGRTGRAEAAGDAFTLMVAEDASHVQAIERFIGQKVERVKLENFDYKYSVILDDDKPGRPPAHERRTRGVRLRGGYYYGPARRRR